MKKHIALLRGINVGGKANLKMVDLKLMMEGLGFENVTTYIQSGNVVFSSTDGKDLAEKISKEIKAKFGYEIPVLVKTAAEIERIVENCPFVKEKKELSYFVLLEKPPKKEFVEVTQQLKYPDEEFVIMDNCVYIYCETGYGKAKLNNNLFEKKLKVAATTRNFRTLVKLVELAG
jgi:uncharacterized protein (DUF1697 family)